MYTLNKGTPFHLLPIFVACFHGRLEVVYRMLSLRPSLALQKFNNETPLMATINGLQYFRDTYDEDYDSCYFDMMKRIGEDILTQTWQPFGLKVIAKSPDGIKCRPPKRCPVTFIGSKWYSAIPEGCIGRYTGYNGVSYVFSFIIKMLMRSGMPESDIDNDLKRANVEFMIHWLLRDLVKGVRSQDEVSS